MTPAEIEALKITLEGLRSIIEGAAAIGAIMLGVIGFLLNRSLTQIDTKLDGMSTRLDGHESRIVRLETLEGINAAK